MPSYDAMTVFWLDDGQRRTPEAGETDPQQAVPRGQFRLIEHGESRQALALD
jgi:hypothetical protein